MENEGDKTSMGECIYRAVDFEKGATI